MNFANILKKAEKEYKLFKDDKDLNEQNKNFKKLTDFELLRELGEGGFGKVFKVRSLIDNKVYAIKGIFKDPKKNKYHYREISMLTKLKHPYIVNYYDYFEDEKYVYLIIEYMENGSLLDFINSYRENKIPNEIVWRLFLQAISGLEYIHLNGAMHRDIKPANLLIDNTLKLKISDFGISKFFQSDDKEIKTSFYSGNYEAPEVITGIYNEKIDIYSMGLVIKDLNQYILRKDDKLIKLFNKMVKKEPKERPSAKEILDLVKKEYYEKYLKISSVDSLIRCLFTFNSMTSYFLNLNSFNIIIPVSKNYKNCLEAFTDPDLNIWTKAIKDMRLTLENLYPLLEQFQEICPIVLFACLFDGLHNELNNKKIINEADNKFMINTGICTETNKLATKINFLNSFLVKFNSYISEKFMGLMKIIRICKECELKTYEFKSYCMFTIDLMKINLLSGYEKKKVKIEECFGYLKKEEALTNYMCKSCANNTIHFEYKFVYSAPYFLILNIKNDSNNKVELYINEELDIKEHIEFINLPSYFKLTGILKKDKEENIYFSNINIENKWFLCKNKSIKEINFKNIKETGEEIIMLFYQSIK